MMCKNKKKIFTFLKSISVFTLPIALIPTFSLTHNFISSDTVNENALPEINTVIASGTNITGSETITSQPTANEILRLANA
jgi:hypothetical protein